MDLVISTIKREIVNLERIRDNHKKNNDQKNVDYLQYRIDEHLKAIEILSASQKSDASESGLNISCVSVSMPDDVDVSIKIENQINFIKNNWNVSENYLDGYAKGFYYCVKFMRGNKR